jgi:hypothetical protein
LNSEAWQLTDTGSGVIITHSSGVDLSASDVEGKFRLETNLDQAIKWNFEPTGGGRVSFRCFYHLFILSSLIPFHDTIIEL